jgi:DNA-binding MarR family transcriptional regulator
MILHDDLSDADLDGWLTTLGMTTLCQWDVLMFLYRHPTSLVGADVIARLVGYGSDLVVAALDVLDGLGLVTRSRVSQTARLYQFTVPTDPQRRDAWARLLALASQRVGRVCLAVRLRGSDPTAQAWRHATQRILAEAHESVRESRQSIQASRQSI